MNDDGAYLYHIQNRPSPGHLASAIAGCFFFIALGGLPIWFEGELPLMIAIVAWVSVGFGVIGLCGVIARMAGWFDGYEAKAEQRNRNKEIELRARSNTRHHPAAEQPELGSARKKKVREGVALMAEHGIFVPTPPNPAHLYAGVADYGGPVKPDSILLAMLEADYWNPNFDPAAHSSNLILHETQVEQLEAHIREQIRSIADLAAGKLDVSEVKVVQGHTVAGEDTVQTRITMTVNGESLSLDYLGWTKYLSTVLHHALATRYASLGTGKRFAWAWVDQGAFISLLSDGAIEALNQDFKLSKNAPCRWEWIDACLPECADTRAELRQSQ